MSALEAIRWTAAVLTGAAAIYVASLNWYALAKRLSEPRGPTWIPLIGGLLGVGSILVEPTGAAREYWWVPLLLDGGSIPGLALSAVYLLKTRNSRQ